VSDESDEPQEDAGAADPAASDVLESVEVITAEVADDGTIVVDDFVAEVDAEGHVVATDELVEIDLPDGTVIIDETFSVADESGELVVIDEETVVLTPDEAGSEAVGGDEAAPAPTAAESNGSAGT